MGCNPHLLKQRIIKEEWDQILIFTWIVFLMSHISISFLLFPIFILTIIRITIKISKNKMGFYLQIHSLRGKLNFHQISFLFSCCIRIVKNICEEHKVKMDVDIPRFEFLFVRGNNRTIWGHEKDNPS